MKISNNFLGLRFSAAGLGVQRKKMNLIAENIANASNTRAEDGQAYKRKVMTVKASDSKFSETMGVQDGSLRLQTSNEAHFSRSMTDFKNEMEGDAGLTGEVVRDQSQGDLVYMPDHPDADDKGYVRMPNVNIITEMTDMIAASRSYEANLTAFNSSKQMAKDTLDI